MYRPRWATACERTSVHYTRVAGYRFDPEERLEKARRYGAAAQRLKDGEEPAIVLPSLTPSSQDANVESISR
jgi:hypothetical protein